MKCKYCGEKLIKGIDACPNCGQVNKSFFNSDKLNRKIVIIAAATVVAIIIVIGAILAVSGDDRDRETVKDSGMDYELTAECMEKNIFTDDETAVLVRTEIDIPKVAGNNLLNSSVKEWVSCYEDYAKEFRQQYSNPDFVDIEYMEPHNDPEFYGTEYPVYFYLRNTIYIPEEDDNFFEIPREDENVLSLIYSSYEDTDGAHGFSTFDGGNFDVVSGELLTLDTLTDDYEAFSYVALDYIIKEVEKKPDVFEEYEDTIHMIWDEEKTSWYMSDNGLVFIYNVYTLAPYGSGPVVIEIPYSVIGRYMKDDYIKESEPQSDYLFDGDINSEEEACERVQQYLDDNDYSVDVVRVVDGTEFGYIIEGYNYEDAYTNTVFQWIVHWDGEIYDEDNEQIN